MKRIITLFLLLSTSSFYGQNSDYLEKNIFKINIIAPSIELETQISQNSTLDFKIGFGLAGTGGSGRKTEWALLPFGEFQYRHYYNLAKRIEKGKSISNNAGNYFSLIALYESGAPLLDDYYSDVDGRTTLGPAWGIQRSSGSFNFGLQLGLGYQIRNQSTNKMTGIIGLDIGWIL